MPRALACVIAGAALAGCTLVDSVDGYAGPAVSAEPDAAGGGAGLAGAGGAATDASGGAACTITPECDDGDLCTTDSCWAGACQNTPIDPSTIADDDTCTDDFCDPKQGIQHVLQTEPAFQILQCGTVTCPKGYFIRKLTCIPECGDCHPVVCANGVLCERPCKAELEVCCNSTCEAQDCPAGYELTAQFSTGDCGCGPGPAAVCTRNSTGG